MSTLFDRKALTDDILLRLGIMEGVIKWHTSRGHNDDAKVAEDVVARFLSALCGWSLVNLNTIRPNYPAADLGDRARRVAVQVTVNGTTDKVRETHEKAIAHKLSEDFDTLIILFLLESAPGDPRKSSSFTPCTSPKIEKWARPQISARLDAQKDESPAAHLARLCRCLEVLREEMSGITDILSAPVRYTRQNLRYASLGSLFVGRADTMLAIRAGLTSGHATAIRGHALHGMGGVGKTRAAVEYAWQFLACYTHILMVNADTPDALDTSLAGLCKKKLLDLPEKSSTDQNVQRNAVLEWLESHRDWLLILDNADSPASLAAVKSLLPVLSEGHVLLTTRLTDVPPQFTSLPLDVLSAEAAAAYLLTGTYGHRAAAPDDAARAAELAGLLDHLALALEQAAACIRVTGRSFADYIAHWQSHTAEALDWYVEGKMDYPLSLARTWQSSVDQLSNGAKFLLQQLAWCAPDPIPYSLPDVEVFTAEQRVLIAELTNLSLARKSEDGSTFTLHRLIQEITRQQQADTQPPPALRAALLWLNAAMPGKTDDVRTWPVAVPLLPHAITLATAAADRDILSPTTRLLNNSALLVETNGDYKRSEILKRRALRLTMRHEGENSLGTSTMMCNLAALLFLTHDHTEAEELMRRSARIDESHFGLSHPSRATSLNNLGELLLGKGDYKAAEKSLREALRLCELFPAETRTTRPGALANLARVLRATTQFEECEATFRAALQLAEGQFGHSHPRVATVLANFALLLEDLNRLKEAEPLMTRAYEISRKHFGELHPDVAGALNSLGGLAHSNGNLTKAREHYNEAIRIWTNTVGGDHPHCAVVKGNLARVCYDMKQFDQAEDLLRETLAIFQKQYPPEHPKIGEGMGNLGELLRNMGRRDEAEPLIKDALRIAVQSFGSNHPKVAEILNNLSMIHEERGDFEPASRGFRRAFGIFEKTYGLSHPLTAVSLNNLAAFYFRTNKPTEAEPMMKRCLEIRICSTISSGYTHPHLQVAIENYEAVLHAMGETEGQIREKIGKLLEPLGLGE